MLQYHLEMGGLDVELAQRVLLLDCFEVDGGVVAQLGPEHWSKSQGAVKHHVQSTCAHVLGWEG